MPGSLRPLIILVMGFAFAACTGGASPTLLKTVAPTQASTTVAPVASPSPQLGATVGTATTALGTFLVGPSGNSLYLFEADTSSTSTCSGPCAGGWPPLVTNGPPIAGSGVKQSLLSTSTRADGSVQVVYNGHPLYYYAGDTKAGDTNGEGSTAFGAGWDVVSAAGVKIEQPGG